MGRHGGGSRSGGSHSSGGRRSGGSRSGGSGARTSKTPFMGCYNRSYVNRRGVRVNYYTSDASFGTKSGWNAGLIFTLVFLTLHMLIMVGGFGAAFVNIGGKVNGDVNRICIMDTIDILNDEEEEKLIQLFHEVYQNSGMPVTLYTDNYDYLDFYRDSESHTAIEVYSEELYYRMGMDEDALIILFTVNDKSDIFDWKYDVYCGDDTTKCFSEGCFDDFLATFQKVLAGQDLCDALIYSWEKVMPQLAKTTVNKELIPFLVMLVAFYGLFFYGIFGGTKKSREAYKYFKEHPEELDMRPMTLYSVCPSCGASNDSKSENCVYCGTLLKISDGNVSFVKPE